MTTNSARDDSCRCGSGKPYRQCCGAVIPIANAERTCGGCTACCDGWLTGNILGHELAPGKPCHFRGDGGCTIYDERPQDPCRGFVCGWLIRGNPFPESFRPDRLGVIIVTKPWRDRFAYVLVHAGRSPDAKFLDWMREHSKATGRPFLFHLEGRQRGYGSEEFQKEILEKTKRGEPLLPGLNPGRSGPCKLMPLDPEVADLASALPVADAVPALRDGGG